ncbi:WXG100 family type VII secretion target [Nocardia sp. NPDC059091]|uniref:WXG100 family type VII secretion target n=1 Tax=unclassified Nocardia TaxID=2637762 RepID=UPI0036CDE6CD
MSGKHIFVDKAKLAAAVAEVHSVVNRMQNTSAALRDLKTNLLGSGFEGDSSSGYTTRMNKFDSDSTELQGELATLNQTIDNAAQALLQQDAASGAAFA